MDLNTNQVKNCVTRAFLLCVIRTFSLCFNVKELIHAHKPVWRPKTHYFSQNANVNTTKCDLQNSPSKVTNSEFDFLCITEILQF